MRLFLLGALAALAACCAPDNPGRPADDPFATAKLHREIALPSVQVRGARGQGSGVVVEATRDGDYEFVLTAWHVVDDTERPAVTRHYPASERLVLRVGVVVAGDARQDLALVKIPAGFGAVARVVEADDLPKLKAYCAAISYGHPLGATDGHLDVGHFSDWDDPGPDGVGYARYSCFTYYGNSGCGVFALVDGTWAVTSICQTGYFGPNGGVYQMGLGARPASIVKFLAERPAPPQPVAPADGTGPVCPSCGERHEFEAATMGAASVVDWCPLLIIGGYGLFLVIIAIGWAARLSFSHRAGRRP